MVIFIGHLWIGLWLIYFNHVFHWNLCWIPWLCTLTGLISRQKTNKFCTFSTKWNQFINSWGTTFFTAYPSEMFSITSHFCGLSHLIVGRGHNTGSKGGGKSLGGGRRGRGWEVGFPRWREPGGIGNIFFAIFPNQEQNPGVQGVGSRNFRPPAPPPSLCPLPPPPP